MAVVRDNVRGIVLMNVAMCTFNLSDALSKYATLSLPVGETIFLRAMIATVLMSVAIWIEGSWRQWRMLFDWRIVARAVSEIAATCLYQIALVHVPMANVSAVFQATPLAMTIAAAIFLGEKIGPRRWVAIGVGFVGVLVIVRPGLAGFEPMSILVLTSIAFVVLRDITTAKLSNEVPANLIALVATVSVGLFAPALIPFEEVISLQPVWIMPDATTWAALAVAASGLLSGYLFLIAATRVAETSAIAPFRYALLVWAFLFGLVLFGDVPDTQTVIGALIVVATGIYSIRSERSERASDRRP
jgi:drug/metabolite transporter (DMT)-like permease